MAYQRWGIGFCPSKRAVNSWVAEGLAALCRIVAGAGAHGALLSGLRPGDRAQLDTIRRHLGA